MRGLLSCLAKLEAYMLPSRLKVEVAFFAREGVGNRGWNRVLLIGEKMRAFDPHIPVCDTDDLVIIYLGLHRGHELNCSFASARLFVSKVSFEPLLCWDR